MNNQLLKLKAIIGRLAIVSVVGCGLGAAYATSDIASTTSAPDVTCLTLCDVQINPSDPDDFHCRIGGEWLCYPAFRRLMDGWY